MTVEPFRREADPRYCFLDAPRRQGFAQLLSTACLGDGVHLVVGEPGVGRSTLLRYVAHEIGALDRVVLVCPLETIVCQPATTFDDILLAVMRQPGLSSNGNGSLKFSRVLQDIAGRDGTPVLLLDDVDVLADPVLERVLGLATPAPATSPGLTLLLAGTPALIERVRRFEPGRQAVDAGRIVQLEPFAAGDVDKLIRFRLRAAGLPDQTAIEPEALALVARSSDGMPRAAMDLCARAYAGGRAAGRPGLTLAAVEAALQPAAIVPAETPPLPSPPAVSFDDDSGSPAADKSLQDAPPLPLLLREHPEGPATVAQNPAISEESGAGPEIDPSLFDDLKSPIPMVAAGLDKGAEVHPIRRALLIGAAILLVVLAGGLFLLAPKPQQEADARRTAEPETGPGTASATTTTEGWWRPSTASSTDSRPPAPAADSRLPAPAVAELRTDAAPPAGEPPAAGQIVDVPPATPAPSAAAEPAAPDEAAEAPAATSAAPVANAPASPSPSPRPSAFARPQPRPTPPAIHRDAAVAGTTDIARLSVSTPPPRPATTAATVPAAKAPAAKAPVAADAPPSVGDLLAQGDARAAAGDFEGARTAYAQAYDRGNRDAALRLAAIFDPRSPTAGGRKTSHSSPAEAILWYEDAARKGDTRAKAELDALTAWLQKAASAGDREAQHVLEVWRQ